MPVVGERENEISGRAGFRSDFPLPSERLRLLFQAVLARINAEFCDDQWAVAREILEAGEVSGEGRAIFEVEIVGSEIRIFRQEIFCGGIVGIGDECLRRCLLCGVDECFEK